MLRGLPACGKTTYAREQVRKSNGEIKRVNKDELRLMLDAGVWSKSNEKFVCYVRDGIITETLQEGKTIIIDDTNFYKEHQAKFVELAKLNEADFEIKDFSDIPLDECLRRDKVRAKPVGERVIIDMARRYLPITAKKIEYNPKLSQAILCDLDGSLAIFGSKNPYSRNFLEDSINVPIFNVIKMAKKSGIKIILISGRKDIYKKDTEQWLKNNSVEYDFLYMRPTQPEGINEPKDFIVKKDIYDNFIKNKFNVEFIIDDRKQVKKMWVENGLFVFDVNQYDSQY